METENQISNQKINIILSIVAAVIIILAIIAFAVSRNDNGDVAFEEGDTTETVATSTVVTTTPGLNQASVIGSFVQDSSIAIPQLGLTLPLDISLRDVRYVYDSTARGVVNVRFSTAGLARVGGANCGASSAPIGIVTKVPQAIYDLEKAKTDGAAWYVGATPIEMNFDSSNVYFYTAPQAVCTSTEDGARLQTVLRESLEQAILRATKI